MPTSSRVKQVKIPDKSSVKEKKRKTEREIHRDEYVGSYVPLIAHGHRPQASVITLTLIFALFEVQTTLLSILDIQKK
jgi:hypothetical protein